MTSMEALTLIMKRKSGLKTKVSTLLWCFKDMHLDSSHYTED